MVGTVEDKAQELRTQGQFHKASLSASEYVAPGEENFLTMFCSRGYGC